MGTDCGNVSDKKKEIMVKRKKSDGPSVYEPDNPEATQEDDMEEDLALLDEEDMGW
jgi:hypothetical protein